MVILLHFTNFIFVCTVHRYRVYLILVQDRTIRLK